MITNICARLWTCLGMYLFVRFFMCEYLFSSTSVEVKQYCFILHSQKLRFRKLWMYCVLVIFLWSSSWGRKLTRFEGASWQLIIYLVFFLQFLCQIVEWENILALSMILSSEHNGAPPQLNVVASSLSLTLESKLNQMLFWCVWLHTALYFAQLSPYNRLILLQAKAITVIVHLNWILKLPVRKLNFISLHCTMLSWPWWLSVWSQNQPVIWLLK